MPPLPLLLLVASAAAAVIDWIAIWSDGARSQAVDRIAKPAFIVALMGVVIAWPADAGSLNAVRPWLLAALTASLVGDVLLLPPARFVAGLLAFLVAHLAYTVAFAQLPGSLPWLVAGLVAAVVLAATVGVALVRAARTHGLAVPVAVYLAAICAMAVAATRTGLPAAVLGAWLFVASDAMLGWSRFNAPGGPSPTTRRVPHLAVRVTYHAGQLLLVVALLG